MNSTPGAPRTNVVVATLALVGTVAAMMQTLITPLLADLPRIFHADPSDTAWAVTVTLLVAAIFTPVAGRLGDMIGKRRMILVCIAPLVIGSIVCALATSVWPMIIGRGLQGMALGIVALCVSLLRDIVPPERLSTSVALISASLGIGSGLGMPVAAAIAQFTSWRVMFWAIAVFGLLLALVILKAVPRDTPGAGGQRFDLLGTVALGAGLLCFLLAVSKGATWGWSAASTLACFSIAVIALLAWGWWELRTSEPLVDLRTTVHRQVLLTNAASVFTGIGMCATMLLTPQILMLPTGTGYGLGQSMLAAGLWMLPGGLIQVFLSPVGGRLIDSRGARFTLMVGAAIIAVGYLAALLLMGTAPGLMAAHMIIKAGVGIAYGAMPSLIMGVVPRSQTSAANSFNSLMRSLGASVGAAVIGVVLAQMTMSSVGAGHTLVSEEGFRWGLSIGCAVGVIAAVFAAALPRTPRAGHTRATAAPSPAPVSVEG
ncbi:MFS transporter [Streptomyces abyssomicinicus]|uniref:MFS transporter n=1 Tax=Streptomyces abyssomicinicus TaxID=574929 RepID=UPI001FE3D365|nr:MFS transporter [Streptomyces abyssomicinicus]